MFRNIPKLLGNLMGKEPKYWEIIGQRAKILGNYWASYWAIYWANYWNIGHMGPKMLIIEAKYGII